MALSCKYLGTSELNKLKSNNLTNLSEVETKEVNLCKDLSQVSLKFTIQKKTER